ncbi:DapH/DapD/GlmU-related protein [Vibrio owensii]|uniref:DapH/DapD/GlmU-related protein n=1 Tax=Vibrio owensii TaxID=696485 RepID=UPI0005ED78C4|nr:DapH/DapD/GlmU-related protein [Vibrio owensii]
MNYQSERILCPTKDASLNEVQIMEKYGEYFGEEPWISFSGCPAITLTTVSDSSKITSSIKPQCIEFGVGCYIESTDLPAFPSGPTKLTCVAINNSNYGLIKIGDNCVLQGTSICSYESVSIGDRVIFGPNVVIMDCSGHAIEQRGNSTELERLKIAPVRIGDDVWIGYGVIILPGVSIGSRTVIGAGSVVCKDIPDDCVAAGNPCIVKNKIDLPYEY